MDSFDSIVNVDEAVLQHPSKAPRNHRTPSNSQSSAPVQAADGFLDQSFNTRRAGQLIKTHPQLLGTTTTWEHLFFGLYFGAALPCNSATTSTQLALQTLNRAWCMNKMSFGKLCETGLHQVYEL